MNDASNADAATDVTADADEFVFAVLRSLPLPLGHIHLPEERIELRVRALTVSARTSGLLDAFARVLMLASRRLADADGKRTLVISNTDLTETLGMDAELAVRVAELVFIEGWMFGGGSGDAGGTWERVVGERFLPVRRVQTIDEYLDVEGRRMWSQPTGRSRTSAPFDPDVAEFLDDRTARDEAPVPVLATSALHPSIAPVVTELLATGHYDAAVRAASLALTEVLRQRSGRTDLDGQTLAGAVLGGDPPALWVVPENNGNRKGEQAGWRMLAQGCFAALRNPVAHRAVYDDFASAFEAVAAISLVARQVDAAPGSP